MSRVLYSLDLGNGDMKVCSTNHREVIVFPSVVGQLGSYSKLQIGDTNNAISNMSLKKDDREYAIGEMAVKNSSIRNHDITDDKYLSNDTALLSHAAFSLLSDSTYSVGNVVIGLPIHKLPASKDVILAYQGKRFGGLLGFYGEYGGIAKIINVDKVAVVAQPHGTLFNLILDSNGNLQNKELARSGVAIYDIGFKTNDGVVFKDLEPIGRLTLQSKNGMFMAYDEIRRNIGVEAKIFEIPQIIRSGTIRGKKVDGIINEAFYNLASNIILEIKSKWDDAWEIDNYVFTGGGAELLKPYLKQVFPNAILPADCRRSNAEGMLKYACRMWGRELP